MKQKTKIQYRPTKLKLIFQNNEQYKQTTDKTHEEQKKEGNNFINVKGNITKIKQR